MGCGCGVWLSDSVLDVFGFDDVLIGSFVGLVGVLFFWLVVGWVFWLVAGFFVPGFLWVGFFGACFQAFSRDRDGFCGEFDPGSGRTLAACLTHASRTDLAWYLYWVLVSGERVSNT